MNLRLFMQRGSTAPKPIRGINLGVLHPIRFQLANVFHACRRLYWRVRRPLTFGVKALIIDQESRVLLVKHTYQPGWHIPGGALGRYETAPQAASRELFEEVGIKSKAEPSDLVGLFSNFGEFSFDHIALYLVRNWDPGPFKLCRMEIAEAGFFPLAALPEGTTPATRRRLEEYQGIRTRNYEW